MIQGGLTGAGFTAAEGAERLLARRLAWGRRGSDLLLEPGVCGGAIVVLNVRVIIAGGEVRGDVGYAVGQPVGMGDREEILQPVPQADRCTDASQVEPPGEIEGAVVLPGPGVVE